MAISWTDDRTGAKSVSHVGLVLGMPTRSEERVMSDIYAYVTRVSVWNPVACKPEDVVLSYGFELNTMTGVSTVDATPEVLAAHNAFIQKLNAEIAEARRVHEEKMALARAKEDAVRAHAASIVNGCNVRVVSGPKADRGTVGKVFWKRGDRIGVQIGEERLPNGWAKNVCWSNVKNVELV